MDQIYMKMDHQEAIVVYTKDFFSLLIMIQLVSRSVVTEVLWLPTGIFVALPPFSNHLLTFQISVNAHHSNNRVSTERALANVNTFARVFRQL